MKRFRLHSTTKTAQKPSLSMKSPPKMPQRAMVRIWVASLHQEIQYPNRVLDFLFCGLFSGLGGWIRTAAALSQKTAQKQPGGLFLAARLAQSTRAHPSDSSRVQTHRGCFIFVCAGVQHILEVEKNGAFVTNLSQKGYKPTFSPQKDCETIVYLVSYRGGWPIVPVCEKK